MKHISLLFVCFAAIMPMIAQDDSFTVTVGNNIVPPSIVGGEEALSEKFSKTFILPDTFAMNFFDYLIKGVVTKDNRLQITEDKIASAYTVFSSPEEISGSFMPSLTLPVKDKNGRINPRDVLADAVHEWLTVYPIHVQAGTINGTPADSMPIEILLHYAPFYYAHNGDTLYLSGEANKGQNYFEIAARSYDLYVRNRTNTPYYALVRGNKDRLILHCCDSETRMPVVIES